MSIYTALLLFAVVAAAAANTSSRPTAPASRSASHHSNSQHITTRHSRSTRPHRSTEECSAPPTDLEVCLTSIFSSMEEVLLQVHQSLQQHEVTIKQQMHHEHTLLYSEISWVSTVQSIARSVYEAVYVDYVNLKQQVLELQAEKVEIYEAYYYVYQEMASLMIQINQVQLQEQAIYAEYKKVQAARWSVYSYISEIRYEKSVVETEIEEIQEVVARLNVQIQAISAKIYQLTKRQYWLSEWQSRLYSELYSFYEEVIEFKRVEYSLYEQEVVIVKEQAALFAEAQNVKQVMANLRLEYAKVSAYLYELIEYEKRVEYVYYYVSREASIFVSAYEEFTCEDSLLYYEACSTIPKSTPLPPVAMP